MAIPNISGSSFCSIFSLSSPRVKKGLTIAAPALLLIVGVVLIALGSVGLLPLLPGVISGVILTVAVLSVVVIKLVCDKLFVSKPAKLLIEEAPPAPVTPVTPVPKHVLDKIIARYQKENNVSANMPYKVLYAGTIPAAERLVAAYHDRYPEGIDFCRARITLYDKSFPITGEFFQHNGEEILFIIGLGWPDNYFR